MYPRRERLPGVIGMALVVHGEQRFLQQILHFVGQADEALSQEGAQMRAQFLEKVVIGRCFASESANQQVPESILARIRSVYVFYSLHSALWLQPRKNKNHTCWSCNDSPR
jgi:hypothetical protein